MDRCFWRTSPGFTMWNSLFTKSDNIDVLGLLEILSLERVGITDQPFQRILENNVDITTELRLQKRFVLTEGTFAYLTRSQVGKRLEVLQFTKGSSDWIDDRVVTHIGKLPNLKVSIDSTSPRENTALTYSVSLLPRL